MGLFNSVKCELVCPHCRQAGDFWVQFKYGQTWQYKYTVGDLLEWGGDVRPYKFPKAERALLDPKTFRGPREGEPGHKRVVVDAVAEQCPHCGEEGPDCEVWLEDDRIVAVSIPAVMRDYSQEVFVILEE